jgi:hypothetical protein
MATLEFARSSVSAPLLQARPGIDRNLLKVHIQTGATCCVALTVTAPNEAVS